MGGPLEKTRFATASRPATHVATRLLGHTIEVSRKLHRKMGVFPKQPRESRTGGEFQRLAVSRHGKPFTLVMERRCPQRPPAPPVRTTRPLSLHKTRPAYWRGAVPSVRPAPPIQTTRTLSLHKTWPAYWRDAVLSVHPPRHRNRQRGRCPSKIIQPAGAGRPCLGGGLFRGGRGVLR